MKKITGPAPASRTCNKCGQEKALDLFAYSKACPFGRTHRCQDCQRVDRKAYKESKREEINAKERARYQNNPEPQLKRQRERYAEQADLINGRRKSAREAAPERHREYGREWDRRHPGRRNDHGRAWKERNLEKVKASAKAYNQRHKERIAIQKKLYYELTIEERRATEKIYRENNRDRIQERRNALVTALSVADIGP